MRQVLLTILLIACSLPLISLQAQTQPSAALKSYTNTEKGFKLDYIATWSEARGNRGFVFARFLPPAPADPAVFRAAVALPPNMRRPFKLDEISVPLIDDFKASMPDAKTVGTTEVKLGGERALKTVLTGTGRTAAKPAMRAMTIACVHKDVPYVLGFIAPETEWQKLSGDFDRMVASFAFVEPAK